MSRWSRVMRLLEKGVLDLGLEIRMYIKEGEENKGKGRALGMWKRPDHFL